MAALISNPAGSRMHFSEKYVFFLHLFLSLLLVCCYCGSAAVSCLVYWLGLLAAALLSAVHLTVTSGRARKLR